MISPTHGQVNMEQVVRLINDLYLKYKETEAEFEITIGTDSQNFSDTKVAEVIAARSVGHGGIYFYDVKRVDRISDIRVKLNYETGLSLELANKLLDCIERNAIYEELFMNARFVIHVDAGYSADGKTKELIPGIVGWVKACGYECQVKPDSYAASAIADKISK